MERIEYADYLDCKAGQEVVMHFPEGDMPIRSPLDAAIRGVKLHSRTDAYLGKFDPMVEIQIRECHLFRDGDILHVFTPGCEIPGEWAPKDGPIYIGDIDL